MNCKNSETNITEILAPAGNEEAFLAALKAGADAIYLGGDRFGARAYAGNFDENALLRTIDTAHLFGRKIYLTVNTLFKEEETEEIYSFLLPFYREGLDAVIVQDLGAASLIRESFPDLHIHASTQMTITGHHSASFLRSFGIERVVPARELSLEEIREIRKASDIEIECFVHGALCYCYSGQCLMSSMAGGRSGNRGRCAQPCRLPYTVYENGKEISKPSAAYALNTKDICTLDLIPEFISVGIDSFKIEGRMKRPEYTAGVTKIYRKYRDLALSGGSYRVEKKDMEFLYDLFNREGFCQSYYKQHNGPDMMALHNEKRSAKENEKTEKTYAFIRESILSEDLKKDLKADISFRKNSAKIVLSADGITSATESDHISPAKNAGLTKEGVISRISKTGATRFRIVPGEVAVEPGLFMTVGEQNALRRKALEDFENEYRKSRMRIEKERERHEIDTDLCNNDRSGSFSSINQDGKDRITISASVLNVKQYETLTRMKEIDEIYVPAFLVREIFANEPYCCENKAISIALGAPLRYADDPMIREIIEKAEKSGAGFLAGSMEDLALLLDGGFKGRIRTDAGLYTMNSISREFFRSHGIAKDTIPYEMNRREIRHRDNKDSELVVYGRIPIMISAQCLKKNYDRCTKDRPVLTLKDRKNHTYPVFCDCSVCRNIIYNPFPVSLLSKKEEVLSCGIGSVRFCFTDETPGQIKDLVSAWGGPYKEEFEFTRGHFGRGIE